MQRRLAACGAVLLAAGLGAVLAGGPPAVAADTAPTGFAAVNALGQNGTTGGAGGPTVTVTNATDFIAAIASTGPRIVRVQGTITLPRGSHDGMYPVSSDKTIIGVGSTARIQGGGLTIGVAVDDDMTAPPANAVHNIIIRNLSFSGASDDALNVQMFSHHIWIDHNDLSTPNDGALDIKRGSSYVTVSWNHSHDSNKNMLLGRDDADSAQDTGRLKVSYHHNWFDATRQRNPRVRYGNPVHVYNNYYNANGDYGVAATIGSGVLVEGNYFENVDDPYHLAEGDSSGGSLVARDNCLVGTEPGETGGSVAAIPYAYTLDAACSVKSIVTAGSGTGKVGAP
jgi:pectate lyase